MFMDWYILQHYSGYKGKYLRPIICVMAFREMTLQSYKVEFNEYSEDIINVKDAICRRNFNHSCGCPSPLFLLYPAQLPWSS